MKKIQPIFLIACFFAGIFSFTDLILSFQNHEYSLFFHPIPLTSKLHLFLLNCSFNILFFLILVTLVRAKARIACWISAIAFNAFFILYAISWELFTTIHQFLTVEGIRFLVHNHWQIIQHILQTSYGLVVLLISFILFIPLLLFPLWLRSLEVLTRMFESNNRILRRGFWGVMVWIGFLSYLTVSPNFFNGKMLIHLARNECSPQATLIFDLLVPHQGISIVKENHLMMTWTKNIALNDFARESATSVKKIPVILIMVESLRTDVLNDDRVMPHLFKLIQDSLYLPNTFITSSTSDYADVAILSSQYPLRSQEHYYYPERIGYSRVLIYDVLKALGYKTGIFSAQNEDWGNMRNYLNTGSLDIFFDATSHPEGSYVNKEDRYFSAWVRRTETAGKLDDAVVVEQASDWISKLGRKDFFISMNLQRSHFPYTWPETYLPPFSPYEITFRAVFTGYPKSKVPIMKNRYFNALAYVDQQLGRLIQFLKNQKFYEDSLIIVTGDSGEAFFEKGLSCHGADLYNEVTVVPMVIKTPHSSLKMVRKDFVQHIDIPPTICHFIDVKPHPSFQGSDILEVSHLSLEDRPVFMSVQSTITAQDAIVLDGWKFIKDYQQDKEFLFDLNKDFNEQQNLINEKQEISRLLREQLLAWRDTQLDFYADQSKFEQYYPPRVLSVDKELSDFLHQ